MRAAPTGVRRRPTQVRAFLAGLGFRWRRIRAWPPSVQVTEGGEVALAGSFLDAAAPSSYAASVDWGDGTASGNVVVLAPVAAGEAGQVLSRLFYGKDGSHAVTMTVTKGVNPPPRVAFG